jgi:DNA-binding beta-propeller fold protein YncE
MKPLRSIIGLALIALCFQVQCARPPKPSGEIRWPPPPQQARIAYVRSIRSPDDLPRSLFSKIKDFLFGRPKGYFIGKPYGVTFDGKSKLYIADTAKKGILVVDLSSGRMKFFNSLGPYGTLVEPVYVVLDREQNIYVADTELGKVVVFDRNMKFQRFIGTDETFTAPVGMCFNKDYSKLYVVDTRSHSVKVFTLDGQFVKEFGRRGDNQGEFHYPISIAISDADTIYVVDALHFAVQAFDQDGNYLFSFGPSKVGIGTMARPRDIAIDPHGHLYVTDAIRNNVQIYSPTGELLLTFGGVGIAPGQFQLPAGICIDKNDYIYVADSINERIQVFKYLAVSDNKAKEEKL